MSVYACGRGLHTATTTDRSRTQHFQRLGAWLCGSGIPVSNRGPQTVCKVVVRRSVKPVTVTTAEMFWMRPMHHYMYPSTPGGVGNDICIVRVIPDWVPGLRDNAWTNNEGRESIDIFRSISSHHPTFVALYVFVCSCIPGGVDIISRLQGSTIVAWSHCVQVVATLKNILILAGMSVDSTLLLRTYMPTQAIKKVAHRWLAAHWDTVRTFATRLSLIPQSPPTLTNIHTWKRCLKRILTARLGVDVMQHTDIHGWSDSGGRRLHLRRPTRPACVYTSRSPTLVEYVLVAGPLWLGLLYP
jgi:hypothetical protein